MRSKAAALFICFATIAIPSQARGTDLGASEVVAVCEAWAAGPSEARDRVHEFGFALHEVEVPLDPNGEFSREWIVSERATGQSYLRGNFRLRDATYPSGRRSQCRFQTDSTGLAADFGQVMRRQGYNGPSAQVSESGRPPDELDGLTITNDAYELWSRLDSRRHYFARDRIETVEIVGVGRTTRFVFQLDSSSAE
jgi:hypothetical protein